MKLDGITTGADGGLDELLGDVQAAIVIDADLGHHIHGLARANQAISKADGLGSVIFHDIVLKQVQKRM